MWYLNGPPGTVVTCELIRVANTAGHQHGGETSHPNAVGAFTYPSVTLAGPYPQNFQNRQSTSDCCGSLRVRFTFSAGAPPVIEHQVDVMFDSFLPIPQTTGIELKPPAPIHPSPYWADPAFIAKLRLLGEQYHAQRHKNIVITDASLPWGGRFDIEPANEWVPPHAEHRNGRQADVRLRDMNDADRQAFVDICAKLGLTTEIHSGNHWHIRLPLP